VTIMIAQIVNPCRTPPSRAVPRATRPGPVLASKDLPEHRMMPVNNPSRTWPCLATTRHDKPYPAAPRLATTSNDAKCIHAQPCRTRTRLAVSRLAGSCPAVPLHELFDRHDLKPAVTRPPVTNTNAIPGDVHPLIQLARVDNRFLKTQGYAD
jgi:hypothetical protein